MNAISPVPSLNLVDLEQRLSQVEPAALLVPPRILHRVIKRDRSLGGLGLLVPHRKSYIIGRETLLRIATRQELELAPDRPLPDTLLLFPQPDPQSLRTQPLAVILRDYERLLFHARIHLALAGRVRTGLLNDDLIRRRVQQIGLTEFEEIETVLRQENFLLPPVNEGTVYEEFVCLYLELRYFAPHLLHRYFPSILSFETIDRILQEDVPAEELLKGSRLPGAASPAEPEDVQDEQSRAYSWLTARAERASSKGNVVRAAILRQRALLSATSAQRPRAEADTLAEIERLAVRLQRALNLSDVDAELWRQSLPALLQPATEGLWPVEARLLYDLQKVCVNQEQEVYAIDLVEWVISLGRKPIKRQLPNQRLVLLVRHLRRALHRLTAARIPDQARQQLADLLTKAIHHGEKELRDQLRPGILRVLDQVGLKPASCAERLTRDKLIEELLDRAVETGFLNMGDLRDAIARNRLKLPDLANPGEFLLGDPLLKANRGLATALDGVYRRSEIYLRWLQRLSALAFGTRIGRFLVLYLLLPVGGAYMILEGLQHVLVPPLYWMFGPPRMPLPECVTSVVGLLADPGKAGSGDAWPGVLAAGATYQALHPRRIHLLNRYSLPLLSLFLLGLLYWPAFRRQVWRGCQLIGWGFRAVFHDLPVAVFTAPLVRAVLQSRVYILFFLYIGKPLLWTLPVVLGLWWSGVPASWTVAVGAVFFAVTNVLLNSPWGESLEEIWADRLGLWWRQLSGTILPDVFRWITFVFKRFLELVEKLLYTVDEWLRFRSGDSRLSLVIKAILGLIWFFVTYGIRVVINVFVEPTINPIKHFPVVTVAAKLLLPVIKPLSLIIIAPLVPLMGVWMAGGVAGLVILLLPGFAGFIAWELKENWRLYRANQPPYLEPMIVGHHGETVARLLRPGFHSGTLPKLFARLRRNLRHSEGQSARKQKEGLHQVEESLHHFTERCLLAVLAASKSWGALPVQIELIRMSTQRIRLELACAGVGEERLLLDFEEHAGQLVAGVGRPGFLTGLTRDQRRALLDALAGFYKLAGVDLLQEQRDLPADAPNRFCARPIAWKNWVETWERDQHGKGHEPLLLPGTCLLPGHGG